jgi:hypothetical protein
MWGRGSKNSNGCHYTEHLKHDLKRSFRHINDPSFIYGMQHVLPADLDLAQKMYPVEWYDSEIFGEALASGDLYPLIAQLRLMNTVVIGNESIKKDVARVFYNTKFIEVPPSNAHEQKEFILGKCYQHAPAVFLFSCGMAANAFIADLHGQEFMTDSFLLDMGHIWDPFAGNMSRCDLEGKSQQEIERNLFPKT